MLFRAILHWDRFASQDNTGGSEPLRKTNELHDEMKAEGGSTNTIISYIPEVCKVRQQCLFMQKVVSEPQNHQVSGWGWRKDLYTKLCLCK